MDWSLLTLTYLENLGTWLLKFIPSLILAIVVLIFGWIFAVALAKVVKEILVRLKLNKLFERTGWTEAFAKAELKVDPSEFLASIVKWSLILVFFMLAAEILKLGQFADFLNKILAYIPNVIVAALMLVAAVVISDILEKMVVASVEKAKIGYSALVGAIVKWAIWIFAIVAILAQLEIKIADWIANLVNIVVTGIVLTFAIAFGLGGKDVAGEILQNLRRKIGQR